jgi:hypothetical protein
MARFLFAVALGALPFAQALATDPSPTASAVPTASPTPVVSPAASSSPVSKSCAAATGSPSSGSIPGSCKGNGPDAQWAQFLPPGKGGDGPFECFKKRLAQMSPEERQRFEKNWERWKAMDDRERQEWKQRAMEARQRMKQTVDQAIAGLGLQLTDDQRQVFTLRYFQERRKIEEELCKEMSAKRDQMLADMLQRLKTEFNEPKSASPTPAASPAAN